MPIINRNHSNRTNGSTSAIMSIDDNIHRYDPADISDVAITIENYHQFKLYAHKYKLITCSTYFEAAIRADLSKNTIMLPNTFQWTTKQLKQCIDSMYGKHDMKLHEFADIDDVHKLLFSDGTVINSTRDTCIAELNDAVVQRYQNKYEFVAKLLNGTVKTYNNSNLHFPTFIVTNDTLQLDVQLQLATYFNINPVLDKLLKVTLNYMRDCHVIIACKMVETADQYNMMELRTACINKIVANWTVFSSMDSYVIKRLNYNILIDIMKVKK